MESPLVSVVMPVFNQERFVEEAIDSVLSQTHANLELIAVDDGSTDASAERIKRFGSRVVYLSRENGGASAARNTGVAAAKGDLIAFCDSDDVQYPERIAVEVAALQRVPEAALVVSDFSDLMGGRVTRERSLHHRWLGPAKRSFAAEIDARFSHRATCGELALPARAGDAARPVYWGKAPALVATIHFAWVGAMMIRRSIFDAFRGFDRSLTHYEDWDLGSRIAKHHLLMYVDTPLFSYRSHDAQLTKRTLAVNRAYLRVIEDVWLADETFMRAHGDVVRRALGSAHWQLGLVALEEKDWATAERCFLRSVRAYPKQKRAYLDLLKAAAMLYSGRWFPSR